MEVEALCLNCCKWFDGHWHNFKGGLIMCPYCKSEDRRFIKVHTDDDIDYVEDNEYDEED